jgi:hypothetical protein
MYRISSASWYLTAFITGFLVDFLSQGHTGWRGKPFSTTAEKGKKFGSKFDGDNVDYSWPCLLRNA